MTTQTLHQEGFCVLIDELGDGQRRLTVASEDGAFVPYKIWTTAYPPDLIALIVKVKGAWALDEIKRDEDPLYVAHEVKWEVLSYIDESKFVDRDLLDFGSGSGASAMVISRLTGARITGVELEPAFVEIARRRAEFYNVQDRVRFRVSPSPDRLPSDLPDFDFITLSAVYEHLLPAERAELLPMLWSRLKPGGVMFLNQTPNRWFPIEHHTTRLPFINYLPDSLTGVLARKFSGRLRGDESWEELLRKGIRGSTWQEVMHVLKSRGGNAWSLSPYRFGAADHFDLWYLYSNALKPLRLRTFARVGLRALHRATGLALVPYISLALEKVA